jgi:hypothetical protein
LKGLSPQINLRRTWFKWIDLKFFIITGKNFETILLLSHIQIFKNKSKWYLAVTKLNSSEIWSSEVRCYTSGSALACNKSGPSAATLCETYLPFPPILFFRYRKSLRYRFGQRYGTPLAPKVPVHRCQQEPQRRQHYFAWNFAILAGTWEHVCNAYREDVVKRALNETSLYWHQFNDTLHRYAQKGEPRGSHWAWA